MYVCAVSTHARECTITFKLGLSDLAITFEMGLSDLDKDQDQGEDKDLDQAQDEDQTSQQGQDSVMTKHG